jgi:OFA family oxalate/formate antiporter-like MFS transporter
METHSKQFNCWLVVVGAVLIQLALGAIYAWSAFTQRLTDVAGDYRFTAAEIAWIFSASRCWSCSVPSSWRF